MRVETDNVYHESSPWTTFKGQQKCMESHSIKIRLQRGLLQHSPSFLDTDKVRMGVRCRRGPWGRMTISRTNKARTGAESSPGEGHGTWGQGPGIQGWSEARMKEQRALSSCCHTSNFYQEGNMWKVLIIIFLGGWRKIEQQRIPSL